jgi:hypothetical protein
MVDRKRRWFARSAELSRQSAELRALSEQIRRRARERRENATKMLNEMREMSGLRADGRDRFVRRQV